MSLSIGIVGLPNVGKSTIFNALTRQQNAASENYPFCTIEPNKAVVPVPDPRLNELAKMVNPEKVIAATIDFLDIAGLVKDASKGEGLGNQFLGNIQETDAILHVVRCFEDEDVVHIDGSIDPVRDIEVIETELIMSDLQMVEKRIEGLRKRARNDKEAEALLAEAEKLQEHLSAGKTAFNFKGKNSDRMTHFYRESPLLTDKKIIYCANVGEDAIADDNPYTKEVRQYAKSQGADTVKVCAGMEEELNALGDDERSDFLNEMGVKESGLDKVIHAGYHTLGLISYLTAGPKEVRAWIIKRGWLAPQAAGVIHSDFERGFIRAQVTKYADYIAHGGEAGCRDKGLMQTKGKDYEVEDGDVIEFLFNT